MWKRVPFLKGLTTLLLFLFLEGVSLLFIAKDSLLQQIKISGALMFFKDNFASIISDCRYYTSLKEINRELVKENLSLKNRVEQLKGEGAQFAEYRDSLPSSANFSYIPAKIISNSTNKLQNFLIIDKGRRAGVEEDMGVITSQGVVGIVGAISDNYALVISFLNITQSVSAKISSSNSFGPLIWEGISREYATLTEIPYHIQFSVGDTILTSGYSTIFPPDLPLGRAEEATLIKGTHNRIKVKLFQDFNTLRFVDVVVNNSREELNKIVDRNELQQ